MTIPNIDTFSDYDTAALQQMDIAHHVHPFTDPKGFDEKPPVVIMRAEGSYIWNSDGQKILDGMAGLWCVNVGYGRQELIDAATKQLHELPYYNSFFHSSTPPQIELARVLSELTPKGLDHIFFANSGSEANDTIIRMVRHFWQVEGKPCKQIFIGRDEGYHGSTVAATSLGGMKAMHNLGHSLLPGFAHIPHPHWYALGADMSEEEFGLKSARALEDKILELGADNVAAFIGEPIQGAGGVIAPPANYWPEIQRICRKYDVLLVADEVICGFGRLGHWFGSDFYGIEPDVMPMAKGLSSGYLPISAIAYSDRIHATMREGGVFTHGYTYSGHPVACAVALANIQYIKDHDLINRVKNKTAPYFRNALSERFSDHPLVGEIRGEGLMAALNLVKDKETREAFPVEDGVAIRCRQYCLDGGLIMRAVGQSMILSPPLTLSKAETDELVDIAGAALDKVAKEVGVS